MNVLARLGLMLTQILAQIVLKDVMNAQMEIPVMFVLQVIT